MTKPTIASLVTENERLRELLKATESRDALQLENYKLALDEHSIVAVTDRAGKISYVNDTFCKISKYNRGELIGKDHHIINSGHHPKNFFKSLWTTIAKGKVWKGDIKNKAKDDSYYWVQTTIVPFKGVSGKVEQFVAIRTDITEKIRSEEKIAKSHARLQRVTEKLKAERIALNRKNIALNELIENVEQEKDKIRLIINGNIETIIFPLLEQVKTHVSGVEKKYVDLIHDSLVEIAQPFLKSPKVVSSRMTPKEIQICNHIKNGMTVKEIANLLHVSPRTVDKHRENIRKKLGINSRKVNLTTHLMAEL